MPSTFPLISKPAIPATPTCGKVGVLYKSEIEAYGLINSEDLDKSCLQTCSYDLRLGDKHYVFDDTGNLSTIFLGTDGNQLKKENEGITNADYLLRFPAGQTDVLEIPPFGSAIIELKEIVDTCAVADNHKCLVVGRFDLKLKAIYKGLISQQATQVEPYYRGKLYCFLHNLTAKEISIKKNEKVATIEFLHAGSSIDPSQFNDILKEIKKQNSEKYDGEYTYKGKGIKDVRWMRLHGRLPRECGLAPINRRVNHNIETEIRKYMEKDSTVNWYSERIGKRIDEHQGIVKLVLSLAVAVVSLVGVSFVTDVLAQLRYFEEQLSFLGDTLGGKINASALASMEAHTQSFDAFRKALLNYTIIAVAVVIAILLIYYFFFSESFWIRRRNRLAGKASFLELRKNYRVTKFKSFVKMLTDTWDFIKALPQKVKKLFKKSSQSNPP